MNLFGPKKELEGTSEAIARLKQWTIEVLRLDEEATVMVGELACTEPGCPPLETVIAVLRPRGKSEKRKIHRAAREISRADVERLWSGDDHQP